MSINGPLEASAKVTPHNVASPNKVKHMHIYYRTPQPAAEVSQSAAAMWLDRRIERLGAELCKNVALTNYMKEILFSVDSDRRLQGDFAAYAATLMSDNARITTELNEAVAEKEEANTGENLNA